MLDEAIHTLLRVLISDEIIWRTTSVPWIRYYYAESGVYLLRDMRHTSPSFALVAARTPNEAAEYQRASGGWEKEGSAE